jgi:hypothetical protein
VTGAAVLDRVELRVTQLVQSAPDFAPGAIDALIEDLRLIGSPLALAIARILELVAIQLVDPGIALPPLAMACATLAGGVRGELGERELEAARYEIDTLIPLPDPPRTVVVPEVPVSALSRVRRPRT